jgi:hypothetical protein
MKARRTIHTNKVYRLPGGTEDNDLWTYELSGPEYESKIICSVWVPTDEERQKIANGENIRLAVWGCQPPVALDVVDEQLGKRHEVPE